MELLEQLSSAQKAAATHFRGVALTVAGAGSGKTRVVVYRIANLIQKHGVRPNQILAVTFTNKAAAEMKHRIIDLIGVRGEQVWVSTFHSFCLKVLRAYSEFTRLRMNWVIYDDGDTLDVLKDILDNIPEAAEISPRVLREIIDFAKSNALSPDDFANQTSEWVKGQPRPLVVRIFRAYERSLEQSNAVDFNDLIGLTVTLLQKHKDVLRIVQQRALFLSVDEYQDTNPTQHKLIQLLAGETLNLFCVGDPRQSIYAFRAANVRNILDFHIDYPTAKTYLLEENYRSQEAILEVANHLIDKNDQRFDGTLKAIKEKTTRVHYQPTATPIEEAQYLLRCLQRLITLETPLNEITILYRTNMQSRVLEDILRHAGIPSRIVGGLSFYERQEIKDILAWARLVLNFDDDVALRRAVKRPKSGLAETSLSKLETYARANKKSLFVAFADAEDVIQRTAVKAIAFSEKVIAMSKGAIDVPADVFFRRLISDIGYDTMLENEAVSLDRVQALSRLENLTELVVMARDWVLAQPEGAETHIEQFLDSAMLLSSIEENKAREGTAEDAVTMMTIHTSKGMEFKNVFIVGIEEGLLPHKQSISEVNGIEEERRLFYVAITRAMDKLILTSTTSRTKYNGEMYATTASRFLRDAQV